MKEILEHYKKIVEITKNMDSPRHILYMESGLPLLITQNQLKNLIGHNYTISRSEEYLKLDEQLLPVELQRAKKKIEESKCQE